MNAKMNTKEPCWVLVGGFIGPLGRHAGYLGADLGAMGDHVAFLGPDLEAMPPRLGCRLAANSKAMKPLESALSRNYTICKYLATARKPFAGFWQSVIRKM